MGKSCLLLRFSDGSFTTSFITTIGFVFLRALLYLPCETIWASCENVDLLMMVSNRACLCDFQGKKLRVTDYNLPFSFIVWLIRCLYKDSMVVEQMNFRNWMVVDLLVVLIILLWLTALTKSIFFKITLTILEILDWSMCLQ